jgi:hypothetical protein
MTSTERVLPTIEQGLTWAGYHRGWALGHEGVKADAPDQLPRDVRVKADTELILLPHHRQDPALKAIYREAFEEGNTDGLLWMPAGGNPNHHPMYVKGHAAAQAAEKAWEKRDIPALASLASELAR